MATNTVTFSQCAILIGDGATPTEGFAASCLVNSSKGISLTANLAEDEVPDCDNPGNPAQVFRNAQSISLSISGAGKVHRDDVLAYQQWLASGASKNAKVRIGVIDEAGASEISCALKLSDFSVNAQFPGDTAAECDITLVSHGLQASDIAAYTS